MEKSSDSFQADGIAGKSAKEQYEKSAARIQERRIQLFGAKLGKFLNFLIQDSNSVAAWEKGALGEMEVGRTLDEIALTNNFWTLHDRKVPRSRANIDHILVSDRGVFVVDAKNYRGNIEIRNIGGIFSSKETLFVGNRNQAKLIEGVKKQVEALEKVLSESGIQVPVFGLLAFVKGEFPFLFKPTQCDGVLINGKGISQAIFSQALIAELELNHVADVLKAKFPAKQ